MVSPIRLFFYAPLSMLNNNKKQHDRKDYIILWNHHIVFLPIAKCRCSGISGSRGWNRYQKEGWRMPEEILTRHTGIEKLLVKEIMFRRYFELPGDAYSSGGTAVPSVVSWHSVLWMEKGLLAGIVKFPRCHDSGRILFLVCPDWLQRTCWLETNHQLGQWIRISLWNYY